MLTSSSMRVPLLASVVQLLSLTTSLIHLSSMLLRLTRSASLALKLRKGRWLLCLVAVISGSALAAASSLTASNSSQRLSFLAVLISASSAPFWMMNF